IGPADIGKAKATFGADVLGRRMDARGFREDFASFKRRLGSDVPYPRVVIGGVDNIEARHEIQHLWADLTIDGAIGDFGCQVSRHPWGDDTACLICLFRQPAGEPAEQVVSRLTGLRVHRAAEGLATITEDDVREAPVEKREWLRARLGHQICSVIQEAVAQHLSEEQQRQGFEPSVPFVACFSASMVVAELVRYVTGGPTPLEPRYQLDMLQGPAFGLELPQERRQDCVCVTRRHNIEKLRRRRAEVAR
ncbi:MAG: hypothetical protein M0Z94_13030, partial [Dehalococcoidales bacterium]|nr:hypothetical protein [Dehalococcoidales bacterium]